MQKQIFAALAVVIGLALAGAYYLHRAKIRDMNNGTVYVRNPNDGTTKLTTPAPDDSSAPASNAGSGPTPSGSAESQPQPPVVTPVADTLPRNPPNGMAYKGTGKFLLYRQGDITWRLDTDTGFACVLLATNAQWSKLRVYQHGCGTS